MVISDVPLELMNVDGVIIDDHEDYAIERGKADRPREARTRRNLGVGMARRRQSRSLRQARTLLDLASFVLPRKITDETIGDAVEAIEKAAKEGVHPWKLQAKALICVFWAAVFTLREVGKPAALLAAIWRLLSGSLW
jgi:hypothetical protein